MRIIILISFLLLHLSIFGEREKPMFISNKLPFTNLIDKDGNIIENLQFFFSENKEGIIGSNQKYKIDVAEDNFYHINIETLPENFNAWIEYEMFGLDNHASIARSINNSYSIGGYIGNSNREWTLQTEQINPNIIIAGHNTIFFSLPKEANQTCSIKNLKIIIQPIGIEKYDNIIINKGNILDYNQQRYIKGYIDTKSQINSITVQGQDLKNSQGEFECFVSKKDKLINIKVILENGKSLIKQIPIDAPPPTTSLEYYHPTFSNNYSSLLNTNKKYSITYKNCSLQIPSESLTEKTEIKIFALREIDLPPLDVDIVNVTNGASGYRIAPTNITLNQSINLSLEIDNSLIPRGYTAKDVRTFSFNSSTNKWEILALDSLSLDTKSTHTKIGRFNDFINGIIKVAESPETAGYAPTSIKDFKAGDASAGIISLNPPASNNKGSVTTNFPIKIPQGRQGMQPNISINYNSEGGNGLLGIGWSLSTSSITIDTRWGVPRYDENLNTETYLLNGQQLNNVAHRTIDWSERQNNTEYKLRVEGSFNKIIRHGNSPSNHWWEVIDKDGTISYYGGITSVMDNAVLKDDNGNISKWTLVRRINPNGHYIDYECSIDNTDDIENGENGRQIYLDKITYTNYQNTTGSYSVRFIRDNGDEVRPDVQINCRLGFKEVTARLLKEIIVEYNDNLIRRYQLNYIEGAFFKTLLESITEFDKNGVEFYNHEFSYFDEVRDGEVYVPYQDEVVSWSHSISDNIDAELLFPWSNADRKATMLGGSKTKNISGALAVTIGLGSNISSKSNSLGGNYGLSRSTSESLISLVDINGDNLPDKLFKTHDDGDLKFRLNMFSQNGTMEFGEIQQFGESFPNQSFSHSITTGNTKGFEAHPGIFFVGKSWSSSITTTKTYLIDRNGDGLIDVVSNGNTYFNYINDNGIPSFNQNSSFTDNPITDDFGINPEIFDIGEIDIDSIANEYPLHDVVRMWVAPFDGVVDIINSDLTLLEDTSLEALSYGKQDGVRATIQFNEESECSIEAFDNDGDPIYTNQSFPNSCLTNLTVEKNDRIYFRLQSNIDGAYDQVDWNPIIEYQQNQLPDYISLINVDANGKSLLSYNSTSDFLLNSMQTIRFPLSGTVTVAGLLEKPLLSDTITLEIMKLDTEGVYQINDVLYSNNLPWNTVFQETITSLENIEVTEGEEWTFRIKSNTNVDWQAINWNPIINYTYADSIDVSSTPISFNAVPSMTMLNDYFQSINNQTMVVEPVQVIGSGSINVQHHSFGFFQNEVDLENRDAIFTLSVKGENTLYGKMTYEYENGFLVQGSTDGFDIDVEIDDTIFFEYSFPISSQLDSISNILIDLTNDTLLQGNVNDKIGVSTTIPVENNVFGPLYRSWGQFCYRGNDPEGSELIDEDLLNLEYSANNSGNASDVDDPDYFDNDNDYYDPREENFIIMYADFEKEAWVGFDDLTYIKSDIMSSSRLGEDDIYYFEPSPNLGNSAIPGISKRSETKGKSVAKSVGIPFLPIGFASSDGESSTKLITDVMDMDGDRYPDLIGQYGIQGTLPIGGLEQNIRGNTLGVLESEASVHGQSINGSFARSKSDNTGSTGSEKTSSIKKIAAILGFSLQKSVDANESSKISIGLNGSRSYNTDFTNFSWLDVNGDGLPDQISKDENGYSNVRLNYGRSFGPVEQWNFNDVRKGSSNDIGAGGGISSAGGSWSSGISGSKTKNRTLTGFQDVNGDGLIDILIADSVDIDEYPIRRVRLNTGTGFSQEIEWNGISINGHDQYDQGSSVGESANAAFTVGIPIPLLFITLKICINPSASVGQGFGRVSTQFLDINGDSYPDYLYSNTDNEVKVKLSTIGKTNLLKSVSGPFNSSFEVDYELVGNTYDLPNAKWVMSEMTIFDGHEGDGEDYMKSTFTYQNGKYDRREREEYGFGIVTTNHVDPVNNTIYRSFVSEYANDGYYTKGLLIRETVLDGEGNKFTEIVNNYELKQGGTTLDSTFNSTNDFSWAFPALIETKDIYYEGEEEVGIERIIQFEYDDLGNITKFIDFGNNTVQDKLTATINYHSTSDYIENIPSSIVVEDINGLVRKREQDIDNNGNVTTIRQYLDNSEFILFSMDYYTSSDANFGNLKKITRPENASGDRMFYEYEYDNSVYSYITKITDAYGYSSSSEYEYEFGQLLKTTDLNGYDNEYEIDERGRVVSLTGPYEIGTEDKTITIEYVTDVMIPYSIVSHFDPENEGNRIETITFLDGMLRPIQVKKKGVIFNPNTQSEQEMYIVSGKTNYDAFGRVVEQYHPTTQEINTQSQTHINTNFDNIPPTITSYDVLDRKTGITLPDGASSNTAHSISTTPEGLVTFKTEVIDFMNRSKEIFVDAKGRKFSSNMDGLNGKIWTKFDYNAISELMTVTDSGENETSYTYDGIGRKLSYNHPDAGLTEFEYDNAGNLIHKKTANLREAYEEEAEITYTYDYERLVQIDYPQNYQNRVVYHYGDTDAPFNRIGRVWLIEDASGGREFYFGKLGEVEKTIRTVIINRNNIQTYVWEAEYDTWNRIQKMTYPDAEEVEYSYNTAGKLTSLASTKEGTSYNIIDQLGYDKFEQKVFQLFGNGAKTIYNYEDDRRRLESLITTDGQGTTIMNNSYTYDDMNNITMLVNEGNSSANLGGNSMHIYEYDEAYRLTEASGVYTGEIRSDSYDLTMQYDDMHNIVSKNQNQITDFTPSSPLETNYNNEYIYDGNKPHAPSKIGDISYEYDANGNLTLAERNTPQLLGDNYSEYYWDEENRLKAVSTDGNISQYTYDDRGERVIKSIGGIQGVFINGQATGLVNHSDNYSAYISPYFVVSEKGFSKHYYVEGQRVLSKVGTGEFIHNDPLDPIGLTAGQLNYEARIDNMEAAWLHFIQNQNDSISPPGHPTGTNENETNVPVPNLGNWNDYVTAPDGYPQIQILNTEPGNTPGHPTLNSTTADRDEVEAGYLFINNSTDTEVNQFYYHSDHLGSSSYITGVQGEARQHNEYLPFGESFVDEHDNTETTPYLFTGKELDEVTGLYYFGARYYNPTTSIWLSVDPMAEKYAGWSPYNYTLQNPIVYVDPNGESAILSILAIGVIGGGIVGAISTPGNFKDKAIGAFTGAVSGGLATGAGLIAAGSGASVFIIGASASITGAFSDQLLSPLTSNTPDASDFVTDVIIGMIPLPGSKKAGQLAKGTVKRQSLNAIKRKEGDLLKGKGLSKKIWKKTKNRIAKEKYRIKDQIWANQEKYREKIGEKLYDEITDLFKVVPKKKIKEKLNE